MALRAQQRVAVALRVMQGGVGTIPRGMRRTVRLQGES